MLETLEELFDCWRLSLVTLFTATEDLSVRDFLASTGSALTFFFGLVSLTGFTSSGSWGVATGSGAATLGFSASMVGIGSGNGSGVGTD